MSPQANLDNFFIDILLYKGKRKSSWKRYILLEKLLIARELIDSNNTCLFICNDVKELIDTYNIDTKNLYSIYHTECIEKNHTPERANFNKMINPDNQSKRNPNIYLINSLITIILDGTVIINNDVYSLAKPLEKFEQLSCNEYIDLCSYIKFCKYVSTICDQPIKEWTIEEGNKLIKETALKKRKQLLPIIRSSTLIYSYCINYSCLDTNNEFEDDAYKSAIEELYAPSPWELPQKSKQDYENFIVNYSEPLKRKQLLYQLPDSHISWINAYGRDYLFQQDKYFLQLLFLLLFVSEDSLDKYIYFIPEYTINIPKIHASSYYSSIQKLLQLPSIDDFYNLPNNQDRATSIEFLNYRIFTQASPWLYFTLLNLSNKILDAAKNLYCSIFIRHRYRLKREDTSFPTDALKLVLNENENYLIAEIHNYCKNPPFI